MTVPVMLYNYLISLMLQIKSLNVRDTDELLVEAWNF